MAQFHKVNATIKQQYPDLNVEAVPCPNQYVYFCGRDGLGKVDSVFAHPFSTTTEDMTRLCLWAVEDSLNLRS